MATGGAAMGIGAENSVPCAGTGPVFVPRLHGDVIVSLCEVSSVDLNPAVRLDLAVARCPALVDYGTAAAGLSRSSLEYIVREQMLVCFPLTLSLPRPLLLRFLLVSWEPL